MPNACNRRQIRFIAPFLSASGYSHAARGILSSLLRAGYEVQAVESDTRSDGDAFEENSAFRFVRWQSLPEPDPTIYEPHLAEVRTALKVRVADDAPTLFLQLPHNLANWPQYGNAPTIGYTMTESDHLGPKWVHGLKCVDIAVSPSTFCTETFRRLVPEVPTFTVPIAVDPELWTPDGYAEQYQQDTPPFRFLSVFNTCERKRYRDLIVAFTEEFSEESKEVGLVLRPTGLESPRMLANDAREAGAWVGIDAEKKRSDYAMAALYRSCHVMALPASEGFGLPFVEAGLCGLPSVALDQGGAADIVTDATGYPVPSSMQPLIGHRMQWYNRRKDRFATATIDDLRAALRTAYEAEMAGAAKGAAARADALARFTPEAIAPMWDEVVDAAIDRRRASVFSVEYPVKPRRATVAGAWGDVMCSLGDIRAMMRDKELQRIGIIYYGRDGKIADWLRQQPWVRDVISILESDQKEMTKTYGTLCQVKPVHAPAAWSALLNSHDVDVDGEIAYTQLCLAEPREAQIWHGAVLSSEAYAWAEQIAEQVEGPFLLLNPLSVASNTMQQHWPFWSQAITWLLGTTKLPIVLVGEHPICEGWNGHPRFVNVSGQSRSMQDVLALAERSAGVITTGNNLGIYAAIAKVPAVVVLAQTCDKRSYYYQWYDRHCTTIDGDEMTRSLVEFGDPFVDFTTAVEARFPDFVCRSSGRDVLTEADYYGSRQSMLERLGRA